MMQYVNCKQYAQEILDEVKAIPNKGKLVIITVGDDPASKTYVKGKIKDCEYCSIPVEHIRIEDTPVAGYDLEYAIADNNCTDEVVGIILQLPLPEGLRDRTMYYYNLIDPHKDVDGLTIGSHFDPCTPKGIVHLMKKELGDLTGKEVLIIGRSNLVGKPLARMLTDEDCTVTLAHSKTKYIYSHMIRADVVISAVGKAKEFDLEDCWEAELVVDVGINRDEHGKLCGDFDSLDEDSAHWLKVTPVPGGVGLLTRAMLMRNVADASLRVPNAGITGSGVRGYRYESKANGLCKMDSNDVTFELCEKCWGREWKGSCR